MKSIIGEIWRIPHRGVISMVMTEKIMYYCVIKKSAIFSSHFFYGCVH